MTTALYRRYRPDTFAEMVGQEHVTDPLQQALRSGRVNHAYLFSGPRGCGKTTSARVLARCLNCAEGPTDTPCGKCESCVELARGGPGSLDVVEIDAASHGGVDDARDLRERATFAPARDRFKVFILDEAHMVTSQGFNALLKIVEEPPEHIKFIFATTEPDKVIGTIRSRTHHYPFRLVPPDIMTPYLAGLCEAEGISVGAGVLPLVVRAGGGSFRDALSVLDQLLAGGQTLEYEGALALLGYTSLALLDDVVAAVSAGDGASAFRVIDQVIATGHEPRRFVEDLLERLRDLIVLAAAGDAAGAALRELPADQFERMDTQARNLGPAELSRAADLVNDALREMAGATSPRLQLELLIARLLLPAAEDGELGLAARLDRLERGGGSAAAGARAPVAAPVRAPAPAPAALAPASAHAPDAERVASPAPSTALVDEPAERPEPAPAPERATEPEATEVEPDTAPVATSQPAQSQPAAPAPAEPTSAVPAATPASAVATPSAPAAPASGGTAQVETELLRRRWDEVLEAIASLRRATWALVSQNAQVGELTGTTLSLVFSSAGLATAFRNGSHSDVVQRALHETLGVDVRVEGTLAGAEGATAASASASAPVEGTRASVPMSPPARNAGAPSAGSPDFGSSSEGTASAGSSDTGSPSGGSRDAGASGAGSPNTRSGSPAASASSPASAPSDTPPPWDVAGGAPSSAPDPATLSSSPRTAPSPAETDADSYAQAMQEIDASDPVLEDTGSMGVPLIAEMLGGTIIDEQVDEP